MDFSTTFPTEDAFQHGFEAFGKAYNDIDWICPAFNFAAALAHASMALGKKFVLLEQGTQYPNFYQIILGRSHLAAKSPTLDRATAGIEFLKQNTDTPESINIISAVNSSEGLKECFTTHENGDPNSPMDWFTPGNGVRGFVQFDELAALLAKTNQKTTSGISVELTRIYNPSPIALENNTRQNKSHGKDWVVNVFGCSTLAWYEKFITEGDFTSGFLNRFVFYHHEQQPIKSRFGSPDMRNLGVWQDHIKSIMIKSLNRKNPIEYELSDEAFKHWDTWYLKIMDHLLEKPDDIKREALARITSQVLKLSLVYAVLASPDNKVTVKQLKSAIAVGEYWAACSGATMEQIDLDMDAKAERRIMERLTQIAPNHEWTTVRKLRQSINSKTMTSVIFNRAIEAQIKSGRIEFKRATTATKFIRIPENLE
ncbi:DUF3987 domain-containing protein [Candidatus Poribacteria bacterium]|nr:DUF3987 domain-containing protein [Candidatus Poribacteria bacterium]